jgi:hypothetical protein
VFETKGLALQDIEGVMAERERRWEAEDAFENPERRVRDGDGDGDGDGDDGLGDGSAGWWSEVGQKMEGLIEEMRAKSDAASRDDGDDRR